MSGGAEGRRLNFNDHTDTVPVVEGWETDPITPVERDGRLYGLCSYDIKAGIACTLNALRAFAESGHAFWGELSFSRVIDEESHSRGSRVILKTDYGITDANVFAGEGGIPCLHLGPQRGGAQQKNEYVPLDWLPPSPRCTSS
ncbi:MAG: M20/M25/M40 family metallo-hydrolase [Candidatus Bathyarchaeota archaeon]|nr:MAG: M20/M25/M40 family metallo-hydrolase [Candidatus Bathyarchaeota archaeon]